MRRILLVILLPLLSACSTLHSDTAQVTPVYRLTLVLQPGAYANLSFPDLIVGVIPARFSGLEIIGRESLRIIDFEVHGDTLLAQVKEQLEMSGQPFAGVHIERINP